MSIEAPHKDDLHLIRARQLGEAFRGQPEAARIVQHLGTRPRTILGDREPLSLFFIDGSHTYEYAKSDTLVSWDRHRAVAVSLHDW